MKTSNLERGDGVEDSAGSKVDYFIMSSTRNAFSMMLEIGGNNKIVEAEDEEASEGLLRLAKETEELTTKRARRLEKVLIQMVAEDSIDYEDGGKAVIREMVPYKVNSIIFNLLKTWIDERLKKVNDYVDRAKETATWNLKSKTEPYTQYSVEMLKLAEEAVGDFFEIPIGISNDLVQELADGFESLFQDYISLVSLCGSKQSYIPTLPPLTRCNKDSKFLKL
ncbi:hypothetical protein GIB67_020639 [Kingdonia uniflora]|uniref:MHD1 domain-containing protein n=1 Tax=Kingdonia uniflora TaxID=39325 RepID=A0A7J7M951_9MAGN|nr:hypothetical protein GIB67_020639 [Kingdonia uniflora]